MRTLYYLLLVCILVVAVFIKVRVIEAKRNVEVVSVFSEWDTHGKPVDVQQAHKGTLSSSVMVSGVLTSQNIVMADVSSTLIKTLRTARPCSKSTSRKDPPCVTRLHTKPDSYTGLYRAMIHMPNTSNQPVGSIISHSVGVGSTFNVLIIPNKAIQYEDNAPFCWVVKNNHVKKQPLTLGLKNGAFTHVRAGLKDTAWVVTAGFSKLVEDDRVRSRTTLKNGGAL